MTKYEQEFYRDIKRIADALEKNELRKQKKEQALIERDKRSRKALKKHQEEEKAKWIIDPKKVPYNPIP